MYHDQGQRPKPGWPREVLMTTSRIIEGAVCKVRQCMSRTEESPSQMVEVQGNDFEVNDTNLDLKGEGTTACREAGNS